MLKLVLKIYIPFLAFIYEYGHLVSVVELFDHMSDIESLTEFLKVIIYSIQGSGLNEVAYPLILIPVYAPLSPYKWLFGEINYKSI